MLVLGMAPGPLGSRSPLWGVLGCERSARGEGGRLGPLPGVARIGGGDEGGRC